MSESLAAACEWTLIRTVVLCLFAWPVVVALEGWLRHLSSRAQSVALPVLLAPFLFPELLVGYAYRNMALAAPKRAELICFALLFVRTVPAGVIALLLSPPALISREAIYSRWILWRANRWSADGAWRMMRCYVVPFLRVAPALGLISLVAFQEFELAALLQTSSWTDWFITAQRLGLEQREMIRHALFPVSLQLPLLMALCFWLTHADVTRPESDSPVGLMPSRPTRATVVAYLVGALMIGCVIPMIVLGWNLPGGLLLFIRQPTQYSGLGREILVAATISLCAASVSWMASSVWTRPADHHGLSVIVRVPLLIPGLIGSLLLSLATVVLFQLPWLRAAYDTPVPWMLALTIWLLPRAMLLRLWVGKAVQRQETYVAQLLVEPNRSLAGVPDRALDSMSPATARPRPSRQSYDVLFRLRDQPHWQAVGLLSYWAYLDLSTACLLAPSSMNSGLVRLYNFMHFGRSAALSAEAFLYFGFAAGAWYCLRPILKKLPDSRW